jgi:surface protein
MFSRATSFNQNIGSWNTGRVSLMNDMFNTATVFNQDISGWNTISATTMLSMFADAPAFNQPIGSWDVRNVTTMLTMFSNAFAFNQNLGAWRPRTAGVNMTFMLNSCGMSTENYSRTLIGWANYVSSNGNLPSGVTLGAAGRTYNCVNYITGATYTNGGAARTYLDTSTPNWTINNDTQVGPCP